MKNVQYMRYRVGLIIYSVIVGLLTILFFYSCDSCASKTGGVNQSEVAGKGEVRKDDYVQSIELSDSILQGGVADTVHFGKLQKGEVVQRTLRIVNLEDKPVVITKIEKSCGCLSIDAPRKPIMAKESATMLLTIDTEDQSEVIYKTVTLQTSLNARSKVLVIMATVTQTAN